MAAENEDAIGDDHWLNWCRLCAKDDKRGNVKIYASANENTWNSVLVMAIRKYFDVHMQLEDDLGGVLCKECYTLISELIDFAEHVTKVQAIFEVLRRSEPTKQLDMDALRQQYGLREGDWSHIIKPVTELENNVIKQMSAEENIIKPMSPEENIAKELPKQEFVDLSASLEGELLVADWKINVETAENPIQPRCRRNRTKLPKPESSNETTPVKKRKVRFKEEPDAALYVDDAHTMKLEEQAPKGSLSHDAQLECLPEAVSPKDCKSVSEQSANGSSDSDGEDVETGTDKTGEVPSKRSNMKCKWCGKIYHNPASYQKHLRVVCRKIEQRPKVNKSTFCELCNKTLSSAAALKLHHEGMHENAKPFVCDHCGKQLKTITALNEHKLVHTEERPFNCSICKASFKNRARLKVHHQIHDEPSFVCNVCGKKLQTRRTWNMHKLVHSEERNFKCDVCGALFKRSKTLKTHLLSHTGLRPYVCTYCGQTFACNANCRAHKLKKHPQEHKKEEGEVLNSRLSVPTLEELRVMSQKIPKVKVETIN